MSTTAALSLVWLLVGFLGSVAIVGLGMTLIRLLRDQKMVDDATEQGPTDAPSPHEVAELDLQVFNDLAKTPAVDRHSFEVVPLHTAQAVFADMIEDQLKAVAFDDLSYWPEALCHSAHEMALAHNRAIPQFREYADNKRFVSSVGGQNVHFHPEVKAVPPRPAEELCVQLARIETQRKAAADRESLIAEVTRGVRGTLDLTVAMLVQKTLRVVLTKELVEITKKQADDDLFHKRVEKEEASKREIGMGARTYVDLDIVQKMAFPVIRIPKKATAKRPTAKRATAKRATAKKPTKRKA